MYSCEQKELPEKRFTFEAKFRHFITPYRIGDTLLFIKKNGETTRIKITGSDSTFSNTKGWFINKRPHKDIQIYCDNLDYHKTNSTDTTLVLINKYPDNLEQSCYFAVLNFRGTLDGKTDSFISVFRPEPSKVFSNCFVIKNWALDLGEEPDQIEYIYVQQTAGIIAMKTYGGEWWLKR